MLITFFAQKQKQCMLFSKYDPDMLLTAYSIHYPILFPALHLLD